MDLKPFLFLALLFSTAAFLLISPGFSIQQAPSQEPILQVSQTNDQALVGETIKITANASASGLTNIQLEFEDKIQTFSCPQNECQTTFEVTPTQKGILFVNIQAIHTGGVLSKRIPIRVVSTNLTCIDSTSFGECSKEKPFFCLNGELVSDCEKCACPESMECARNTCSPFAAGLALAGLKESNLFIIPGTRPSFTVFTTATQKILAKANFSLKANLYSADKKFFVQKDFALENELAEGMAKEIHLQFPEPLPSGVFSLSLELFGKEKLSEQNFENALTVREPDSIAPSKPIWVGWSLEENQLKLSWVANPEDDLKEYVILQSRDETAGYIAYSALATIPSSKTSFLLQTPLLGNFFILRAVDWYGNESQYSEVLQVSG